MRGKKTYHGNLYHMYKIVEDDGETYYLRIDTQEKRLAQSMNGNAPWLDVTDTELVTIIVELEQL